jgi:hypothetical protein
MNRLNRFLMVFLFGVLVDKAARWLHVEIVRRLIERYTREAIAAMGRSFGQTP